MKTIKYTITGLCAYFIICCYIVAAQQQVSINEAQKAAVQYLNTKQNRTFSLRETDIQKVNSFKNKENKTLMYETVLNDGQGILLSGSKACLPVLGYFKLPEGKSIKICPADLNRY